MKLKWEITEKIIKIDRISINRTKSVLLYPIFWAWLLIKRLKFILNFKKVGNLGITIGSSWLSLERLFWFVVHLRIMWPFWGQNFWRHERFFNVGRYLKGVEKLIKWYKILSNLFCWFDFFPNYSCYCDVTEIFFPLTSFKYIN